MDMDTISLGFFCFTLGGMESHDFIVLFSVMTSLWSSDFQSPNSVTDFDLMPGMGCHRTIPYCRQPESAGQAPNPWICFLLEMAFVDNYFWGNMIQAVNSAQQLMQLLASENLKLLIPSAKMEDILMVKWHPLTTVIWITSCQTFRQPQIMNPRQCGLTWLWWHHY
jgi:hypothetical protein